MKQVDSSQQEVYKLRESITFDDVVDSAQKEIDKAKAILPLIKSKFKDLEIKVISKMDETIRKQFK